LRVEKVYKVYRVYKGDLVPVFNTAVSLPYKIAINYLIPVFLITLSLPAGQAEGGTLF
jgi:hypothetical protein